MIFSIRTAVLTAAIAYLAAYVNVTASPAQAQELALEDGASIVMYHRFGEGDHPSTNTTLEQLDAHIKALNEGDYTVLALPEIVKRLKAGEGFPAKSVGVSIDDAYRSVYTEAWPRFKKAGIPFTLFVATDPVNRGLSRYMTWDMIREIAADPLVTIGSQTATHLHMIASSDQRNIEDLETSNARFREELGFQPNLIAYPYGEFADNVVRIVKDQGFIAGFGQHSGAFGAGTDIYRLPRFAMNESFGDVSRLRTAAGTLPLPVTDAVPADTVVDPGANPPNVGFTLPDGFPRADQLACFSNHEGKLKIERLGPRVEVRMTQKLPQGRTRLNCTVPASGEGLGGRWLWFGQLFYVK